MPRAKRTCVSCGKVIDGGTRCGTCDATRKRGFDQARGSSTERGYNSAGHKTFRRQVLARDPICVLCRSAWATIADHYPLSRRELIAAGSNPDDPDAGRGLCKPCHDRHTAQAQPGGWAARG